MLFAAAGLALGGIDDLVVDILFLGRWVWRRLTVYSRHRAMTADRLPHAEVPGAMAIFVPAWHEADVIGAMLRSTLRKWWSGGYRIYVGAYPNDPDTLDAIRAIAEKDDRVQLVVTPDDGPTTKADCLNALWRAMLLDEIRFGQPYKAVVLHDAEDVVHPDALRLLDRMADRFDLVQLPVLPFPSQQSKWVSGHYLDEFAESHGKMLAVREAVGAAVPSAGVGCAFSRRSLAALAEIQDGKPFDPSSLTEDYEVGLRIVERGGSSVFVRMADGEGKPVCTREHFPETLEAAVKQKARWTVGIALSGWDRLGWHGGLAERWMRLRDRRAALAALVLFAAYLSLLLHGGVLLAEDLTGRTAPSLSPTLTSLLAINGALMLWRMGMRAFFVQRAYGWEQALRSIPRTVIANMIAILAARRAIAIYLRLMRGRPLVWDKTQHRFPTSEIEPAL